MKFTMAVLLLVGCNGLRFRDDCDMKWCNNELIQLPEDLDEKPIGANEANFFAKL